LEKNLRVQIRTLGDLALTIEIADAVSRSSSETVLSSATALRNAALPGVREVVPAFCSITVHLDAPPGDSAALQARILALLDGDVEEPPERRRFTIPVLYGGAAGPDLDELADLCRLPAAEVVARHGGRAYHVHMLGFLPGFAYLGEVEEALRQPRLDRPRTRVPQGSVAVADAMTAVYPSASPGGWRLIGQTPVRMFDPQRAMPCPLAAGDVVTFSPISSARFAELSADVADGYWLEPDA
jgi:KipI family sensor histidine kinase inhibitor